MGVVLGALHCAGRFERATIRETMTAGSGGTQVMAAVDAGDGMAARRALAGIAADGRAELLEALARRAAQGGVLPVELLVELLDDLGLPRRAVRRFLIDENAVEDVAQDTLVAVAASVGSFRGDAKFTTWLHQLARNRAVDHLRRQRATEPLADDDVGDAQRISSVIASREAARALAARLPQTYREAVWLRDVERLPYVEAAQRLGRNVNTVKSQVARGRALLARMLATEDGV